MKKFKRNFGIKGSPDQIKAFAEYAESIGWNKSPHHFNGGDDLWFNGSKTDHDLPLGTYWLSGCSDERSFHLPSQWSEAIQAASEVEDGYEVSGTPVVFSSLIPFDLEKALNGAKVVTEDRTEITDLHEYNGRIYGLRRLTALSWDKQGNYLSGATNHPLDLFLLPEEKVCYRNVYPDPKADGLNCTTLAECDTIKRKDALCVLAFTTIGDKTTVSIAHTY